MNLFASSLFLLFTIGTVFGEDPTAGQMVTQINEGRKKLAEALKIANMQKMVLDDKLNKAADEEMRKCIPNTSDGPDFKMMNMAEMKIKIDEDAFLNKSIPEGTFLGSTELFLPTKSQIGFARGKCNGEDHGIAAIGPGKTWKYSDFKKGPPGSACDAGQNEVDGLCVGKRSSAGEESNEQPSEEAEGEDNPKPEPLNGPDPEDHQTPPQHSESTTAAASSSSNESPIFQTIPMFLLAVLFL